MHKIRNYNNRFLDQQRSRQDPLADNTVAFLFESGQSKVFREVTQLLNKNSYQIPKGLPEEVKNYLEQSRELPHWADDKKIREGQLFFKKHAVSLSMMLFFMSLPYDYAAANGAQVLALSSRMNYDLDKRLIETGKYVFDVGSPQGFSTQGSAIASAQKVRLIHAAIRYHIKKSGQWSKVWGEPINQEDMAGTNLSMSLIPIRGMRKLGIDISRDTSMAYIHLWNLASYVMGVEESLLPDTAKEAFLLDKLISERQFRPSEEGKQLTASLLAYVEKSTNPQMKWLAPGLMRFLLGDDVANTLGIPQDSLPAELLLNPLQNWNKLSGAIQPTFESFYLAKGLYRQNSKKINQGKEVALNVPNRLRHQSES